MKSDPGAILIGFGDVLSGAAPYLPLALAPGVRAERMPEPAAEGSFPAWE